MSRFIMSVIVLCVLLGVLVLGVHMLTDAEVTRRVEEVEETQALEDIARVRSVITLWERQLGSVAGDWGPWDDTYALATGENPGFAEDNLGEGVLENLGADLMLFTDLGGVLIEGRSLDDEGSLAEVTVEERAMAELVVGSLAAAGSEVSGVVVVRGEPLLIATAPITTSARDAPLAGHILAGRYLHAGELAEMSETLLQPVSLHALDSLDLPDEAVALLAPRAELEVVLIAGEDRIAGLGVEHDLFGEPAFVFEVERSRPAFALARSSMSGYAWILGVFWLLSCGLVARALFAQYRETQVRDQAIAERDMFFASASHDLRTPLNSIIGFTGVVLSGAAGPLTDEQHRQLSMSYRSSKHLLLLVDDVLQLQRGVAREFEPEFADTDICAVVRAVAEMHRAQAEEKGLSLEVASCPDPVTVHTDEQLLTRILENLLSNAVRYTNEGRVRIDQWVEGAQAVVRVEDTGPGIPADALARVFEPFYRVPGIGDAGRADGTGLGLAIVQRHANVIGARIEAESEPGRGTTFTLRLKRT